MSSKPALRPEEPRRRDSKQLPPNLSELMNQLSAVAASFIQMFDSRETRMREIVDDFLKIAEEVKTIQRSTDRIRQVGVVTFSTGAVAVAVGLAYFTAGLSLAVPAIGAAAGGVAVVYTNVRKLMSENGKAEEVKKLGEEFLTLIKPLKEKLEEIQTVCEKLQQTSSKGQAESAQREVEEFQEILRRVMELKKKSGGVLVESTTLMGVMHNMVLLLQQVFRVTATPEEDQKLGDSIIHSADQSLKVLAEFSVMKEELEEFRGE